MTRPSPTSCTDARSQTRTAGWPDSGETADWVRRQNDLSRAYLADLPGRAWFSRTMSAVMHRPRAGVPGTKAGWYLVSRNDGSTPQDIVYAARSLAELLDGGRAIVDSHKFTATLQWAQAGDQPVLTRVETSTGHGFGKPAGWSPPSAPTSSPSPPTTPASSSLRSDS